MPGSPGSPGSPGNPESEVKEREVKQREPDSPNNPSSPSKPSDPITPTTPLWVFESAGSEKNPDKSGLLRRVDYTVSYDAIKKGVCVPKPEISGIPLICLQARFAIIQALNLKVSQVSHFDNPDNRIS